MKALHFFGRARCLVLALMLVAGTRAQAQPEPIKFGQIDAKDLTAAPFVGDSAAAGVVLCDYGRAHLDGGRTDAFQVVFERVTRIKILRKSGYDLAAIEIPMYQLDAQQERLSSLRGFTYNLVNGQVVKTKLEAEGSFLEKRTPHLSVQKFTLPNVREGSIIEYAYTMRSDFIFNFQNWVFQREIPVRWSEYRASIPTFYRYKIIYQGNQPLTVDKPHIGTASLRMEQTVPGTSTVTSNIFSTSTEEHQWVLKDVPAFREEPYMTTEDDYLAKLDFQLAGEQWPERAYVDLSDSWLKINARLLEDDTFGHQLERVGFLKEQMQALALEYPDPAQRAAAVREVVMGSVRYNGVNRYSSDTSPRKAYDAHTGTSADLNLLLIAALRGAGLPAQPVLLSTRDHGHVSQEFTLLDKFNYVVALVALNDGKDLLVDATDPLLPCGVLPARCLNQVGRLISAKKGDEGRWVPLAPTQNRVHFQQATLTLDAAGNLTGRVREEFGGYAGAETRRELATQGDKKFLAGLVEEHEGWAVPKLAVANRDSVTKPLGLSYAFSRPAADAAPATTLYLSPLREFGAGRNPFRHENRRFAVDLGVPEEET
ncbi:MAG: hypothetical protein JWR44_1175, partial [Hymenobacter sp.]|nr:hypothetical protein [Hymenobacter sp.]